MATLPVPTLPVATLPDTGRGHSTAARAAQAARAGHGRETGACALQGKLIQRLVRFQTYSHLTIDRGFS